MTGVETVEIEILRLPHGHDLQLPDYSTAAAAGADLLAAIDQDIELGPLERRIVPTGISIALPVGTILRSSDPSSMSWSIAASKSAPAAAAVA